MRTKIQALPAGWKARALRGLEALAPRITALKGRMYLGCGFHYEMVRECAYLTRIVPTVNEVVDGEQPAEVVQLQTAESIIAQVRYKALVKNVADAEKSADDWTREHPG